MGIREMLAPAKAAPYSIVLTPTNMASPLARVLICEVLVIIRGQSRSFQFPLMPRIIMVTRAGLMSGSMIRE